VDNIVQKIERERKELIEIGMKKGFQNAQVIEKSQMLDELINQYYRLTPKSTEVKTAS